MPDIKIAPSILSADFGRINEEIAAIEDHVDYIHMDVMDGVFVPNITFGNEVMKNVKSAKPLDTHLMIVHPEKHVEAFAKAGANILGVQAEACDDLLGTIQQIKGLGIKACAVINPPTPLSAIESVLDAVDQVLVMTVNPGFAGQSFMPEVLPKIQGLRKKKPGLDIEVDGGIDFNTVVDCARAGANVFVSGSTIFKENDRIAAIASLREGAQKGWDEGK